MDKLLRSNEETDGKYAIKTIRLPIWLGMGKVNCYLVQSGAGQVLIDTGGSNARKALLRGLVNAGYTPGSLRLVILTHGDFDHCGNAAFLRAMFGVNIGMHPQDAAMVEKGDMFANRKQPNIIIRWLINLFAGLGRSERFTPDIYLKDGASLAPRGLDAKVIHLPGHTRGSIGMLTATGDLFCGDFFENRGAPALNTLMDDREAAAASLAKLERLPVRMVYPGHGRPFELGELG